MWKKKNPHEITLAKADMRLRQQAKANSLPYYWSSVARLRYVIMGQVVKILPHSLVAYISCTNGMSLGLMV